MYGHRKAHVRQDVKTMMARPRLQSVGQDAPPLLPAPPPPPDSSSPQLIDVDGGRGCSGLRVSPCSSSTFRVIIMPFLHERPAPLVDYFKPSAGLLCSSLSPPFHPHAKFRHVFHRAHHPIILLPPWVAFTLRQLPKCHPRGRRSSPQGVLRIPRTTVKVLVGY